MRFRAALFSLLVTTGVARADLTSRALAAVDTDGGGSTNLGAWAGPARQTSLPQLLELAVRLAPSLQSAKLDIEIAHAQIQQTWARNDWYLTAEIEGSWTGSGLIAGVEVGSSKQFSATAEISRTIWTGGRFGFRARTHYEKTEATLFGSSELWSDQLTVTALQPILRGAGSDIFDANERRAELSRDAAVLARRQTALQTVQSIVSAYWDLVLAERQVAITEASLTLARERLRITELGASGGKIAFAEIPAVQQIIATREEDVLGGELLVLDRSIALRRAVGMPIGAGELGLRVATELEAKDQGWTLASLLDRAYTASPELAILEKRDAGATLDIDVTENGLLPQLDLALSFGPTGTDGNFGSAWRNTITFDDSVAVGTLTYTQSKNRHDVKGRSRELRAGREKLRVDAVDVRAQIAQTMSRAVAQIELAKRRVVLSQRAIALAKENIRIETDRFNLGKATNFDVLNRVEEQRQAELRQAQALVDWHKAEAVVLALTGDLLPVYGITLD